jgi:hypothetical protein
MGLGKQPPARKSCRSHHSVTSPLWRCFIEVRVEPSRRRIRLLPYGVHGRLTWSDLVTSRGLRPAHTPAEAPAEWVVEMPGQ